MPLPLPARGRGGAGTFAARSQVCKRDGRCQTTAIQVRMTVQTSRAFLPALQTAAHMSPLAPHLASSGGSTRRRRVPGTMGGTPLPPRMPSSQPCRGQGQQHGRWACQALLHKPDILYPKLQVSRRNILCSSPAGRHLAGLRPQHAITAAATQ